MTIELSVEARIIGAPKGLKYGDSSCIVGVTRCADPPMVTWTLDAPTKKNGTALLHVVVQPSGIPAPATMLLMCTSPAALTVAPLVAVP